MNRWKTDEDGTIFSGTTDISEEIFKESLRPGVKLILFENVASKMEKKK